VRCEVTLCWIHMSRTHSSYEPRVAPSSVLVSVVLACSRLLWARERRGGRWCCAVGQEDCMLEYRRQQENKTDSGRSHTHKHTPVAEGLGHCAELQVHLARGRVTRLSHSIREAFPGGGNAAKGELNISTDEAMRGRHGRQGTHYYP